MTHEERIARRAEIERTLLELGAVPTGAYEPPESCVMLTTVGNRFKGHRGGVALEVGKRRAAVHIVEGTHRLATEEEIEAYHQAEFDRMCAATNEEDRRNRRTVVFTEPPAPEESSAPVDESLTPS